MPLYCCTKCGCVENTALSNYWATDDHTEALCTECDPAIAAWHGVFQKRSAVGMLVDDLGLLWGRKSVEDGRLPSCRKVVGQVDLVDGKVQVGPVRPSAIV